MQNNSISKLGLSDYLYINVLRNLALGFYIGFFYVYLINIYYLSFSPVHITDHQKRVRFI